MENITLLSHNQKSYTELCKKLDEVDICAYVSAPGTGKSYVAAKYAEEHGGLENLLVIVPRLALKKVGKTGSDGNNHDISVNRKRNE